MLTASPVKPLTPREVEIAKMLALPEKVIADRLGISSHVVKFHTHNLMKKLGRDTRTGAVIEAMRRGAVGLDDLVLA